MNHNQEQTDDERDASFEAAYDSLDADYRSMRNELRDLKETASAMSIGIEQERRRSYQLTEALKDALPWLERGVKFYKFQSPGREFFPNREEAEGAVRRIQTILEGAGTHA